MSVGTPSLVTSLCSVQALSNAEGMYENSSSIVYRPSSIVHRLWSHFRQRCRQDPHNI
jgi:hypothetical protein